MTIETNNNDYEIVNIKVENKQRVMSDYSFDGTDKLNKELSDFIEDKTKNLSTKKTLKFNFYTPDCLDQKEVKETIKNHFSEEYKEAKEDLKKSNILLIVMLSLGIITISLLFICLRSFSNFYFEILLEIAAWLFIWEAMEDLFFSRPKIKKRCIQMKQIYTAKVEIVNYNEKEK